MFVLDLNKIHSYVDIITNSSTVIYTWSENSVDKARHLLQAMLQLFGSQKNVDDVFYIKSVPESIFEQYELREYMENSDISFPFKVCQYGEPDYKEYSENCANYTKTLANNFVMNNNVSEWYLGFVEKMGEDDDYTGFNPDTHLVIIPKDKKYEDISKKMIDFLYSTEHDGTRDG